MEIYVFRHGETLWNKDKRLQGSADVELNEKGRELARIRAGELEGLAVDAIYSSPLKRAYETAVILAGDRKLEVQTDPRIRELSFGSFEGRNMRELEADETLAFRYFFDQPERYVPPVDGETLEALIQRAGSFMQQVIEPLASSYNRVFIVAHGAMNKAIMAYALGREVREFWAGGLQRNCEAMILEYQDGAYVAKRECQPRT